ncbi:MAG: GTP pyrophosphokinase [Oscillospiraceae bacterium]
MIYTEMTKKAIRLMYEKQKDQTDKSGLPYVFHPFHVAEQMRDEKTTVCALLHDILEDTDTTAEELLEMGFEADVVDAVRLMTHDDTVPYLDYIRSVKANPIARAVKLADLAHNSDITRLPENPDPRDVNRLERYRAAIAILEV